MLPFLFLNVVVSTLVVLSILFWWDNRGEREAAGFEPTAAANTDGGLPTPVIADPPSGTIPPQEPAGAESGEDVIHIVQAGETLNIISQRYDVSLDDIMQVNGMDNPNFIAVPARC